MDVPLNEVVYVEGLATGTAGAVDADSTPTFAVYEEATDTDVGVGGNMTKRTSLTGDYRASFTASAANGFELGKWYSVIGSAAIAGATYKAVLARFRVVVAENTAGYPAADVLKVNNTDQTARDLGLALPAAAAGASGGLLISGSNSGTTTLGALTVSGATTLAALSCTTLTASGAVAFQSTFAVTTSTALAALSCSTLTASGAVAFQSTFATTGTTTFNALTVTNALTVSGATTLTGAVTASNAGNSILVSTVTTVTNQLTAAAVAAGVWQDATAGDFAAANSVGKSLYNAFTSGTSVFTTAALANAPTGGSAPTAAAVATAVWQDATAGDFTVSGSVGKSLFTGGNAPGAASGLALVGSAMALAASQHVIVDSGTVTTLTNLPAAPTDWLTAAAVKADAVTKIQAGLAGASAATKLLAAVYDTATVSAGVITLSDGATQQIDASGRTTTPP